MQASRLHISCAHCQTTNRVPAERLTDDPVCGHCGRALLDGATFTLSDANFDAMTSRTDLPILVDFWAPWCGPCTAMAPHFENAARTLKGRAMLAKVNSDDNPRVVSRFAIRSIPTMIRLKNGKEISRQTGAVQEATIVAFAT
jgi:thioredoxin 2